jgi:hypothetical protein
MKYIPYIFMDEPVSPMIEGTASFNFTASNTYNSATGLYSAVTPIVDGTFKFKNSENGYKTIPMHISRIDYNTTNMKFFEGSFGDGIVKGKFTLDVPVTNADLYLDENHKNEQVGEFSFQEGEFHLILFGVNPKYVNNVATDMNYEAYGWVYFYGTYEGQDKVLVMDFVNNYDFTIEGLGQAIEMRGKNYRMEGDVYCYPGATYMGWQSPAIWSYGDQTLTGSASSINLGYMSDNYVVANMPRKYAVESTTYTDTSKDYTHQVTVPVTGTTSGKVTANIIDGYSGDMGYEHFNIVKSGKISSINVVLEGMSDPQNVQMRADFTPSVNSCDKYAWDWGDGTVVTGDIAAYTAGTALHAIDKHTYEQAGVYPVTFKVYDHNTLVASQSYHQYLEPAMYQQYIGVKGVTPITIGQYQDQGQSMNLVLNRSSFTDIVEPGIYTAEINWGDNAVTTAGMYTTHNRLIYKNESTGKYYNDSLSGTACGGHVYDKVGDYTATMTIYKDGKVFGIVHTEVHVDSIYTFDTKTVYTGSLGEGPYNGIYYSIDWGDGDNTGLKDYSGGTFTESHDYGEGGIFLVTVSYWKSATPSNIQFYSYTYPTVVYVQKGMDISVNGADIVLKGGAYASQDASQTDTFHINLDIPTNVPANIPLQVVYHWGDQDTTALVYAGEDGVVHLGNNPSAYHEYTKTGVFKPRVELLLYDIYRIGIGTSDSIDVTVQAGPIMGPTSSISGTGQFTMSTTIPGTFGSSWTLLDSSGTNMNVPVTITRSNEDVIATFECANNPIAAGKYTVLLQVLDSNNNVLSSEVYYYVSVA